MGRKGSWTAVVNKVFVYDFKGKSDQTRKSEKWYGKQNDSDVIPLSEENKVVIPDLSSPSKDVEAIATAKAAEAAVAAVQVASDVVQPTTIPFFSSKLTDEVAATKIQTAFRGYLARKSMHVLKGPARLKTLICGPSIKRQVASTLRCMQTLAHVQSQIHSRRIRMLEENRAFQQQLQQKRERELEKLKVLMGDEWDDSTWSKEQIETILRHKQEAAIRRERALAYAYSHQQMWKKTSKSANTTFMDSNNPHWGWSWLERWMAARPWDTQSAVGSSNHDFVKSIKTHDGKASLLARRLSLPSSYQFPCTLISMSASSSSVNMKKKTSSTKSIGSVADDDSKSLCNMRSKHYRRHSIGGSSVVEYERLASSPSSPRIIAPTQTKKVRSLLPSPSRYGIRTLVKGSMGSARKQPSFSNSP